MRNCLFAAVAIGFIAIPNAFAQDMMGHLALGLSMYEGSANKCEYADVVGQALHKMDDMLVQSEPYRWDRLKRESTNSAQVYLNLLRATGNQSSECSLYGITISETLMMASLFVGQTPELNAEIQRLKNLPKVETPSANIGALLDGPGDQSNPNNNPDLCEQRIGGCDDIMDNDPSCGLHKNCD